MSLHYAAVQWNRQKRVYDGVLVGTVAAFLLAFIGVTKLLHPLMTDEILLMRASGVASIFLMHLILCIGPLCRLDPRFLPLLYNRRHAGVVMFLLALVHAVLVVITYHAGGDMNPILSIFNSTPLSPSVSGVPFQAFGFVALVILLLMAVTSHDFWLANLGAPFWKALHMMVYLAYGLLVLHVAYGVLQSETHPIHFIVMGAGMTVVLGLHLLAARSEWPGDQPLEKAARAVEVDDGFLDACSVEEIPENRARIVCIAGERVAVFRYDGNISAVSNVCQHQNGPLGEGRILNGCITCPWHGYQYLPETGASPPPFQEKVSTFNVRVRGGRVWVHPVPNPPGTRAPAARIAAGTEGAAS